MDIKESRTLCLLCDESYPCGNIGCELIHSFNYLIMLISQFDDDGKIFHTANSLNLIQDKIKELELFLKYKG